LPHFSTFSSLSHTFPITKFTLSIIFVKAWIWNFTLPSGGCAMLFWSNIIISVRIC
jgi:hypothetical protein